MSHLDDEAVLKSLNFMMGGCKFMGCLEKLQDYSRWSLLDFISKSKQTKDKYSSVLWEEICAWQLVPIFKDRCVIVSAKWEKSKIK